MGLARALRRHTRRQDNPVAAGIAQIINGAEAMAEAMYNKELAAGQAMPSREEIEAVAKMIADAAMAPAINASLKKGIAQAEVDAYSSILTARVQIAFQEKWSVLERRHAITLTADINTPH